MASRATNGEPPRPIYRPKLVGDAYERHKAYVRDVVDVYQKGSRPAAVPQRKNDFDVLKETHKFIREEGEPSSSSRKTWEEALALKYEATLFKEFAVCDLKHHKSGNIALRWRTEEEVLSGVGESTCGNLRCAHHFAPTDDRKLPPLSTLEVPFAYVEHGETKQTLVKLVLCDRCTRKLMYKRNREREEKDRQATAGDSGAPREANELGRQRSGRVGRRGSDNREAVRRPTKNISDDDPPEAEHTRPRFPSGRPRRSASPPFSRRVQYQES